MKVPKAQSLACLLVLVLAPLTFLWSSIVGGKTYLPFDVAEWGPIRTTLTDAEFAALQKGANHDSTEVTLTFRPEWKFAAAELRSGRLPEWNPYARIGAPLLATSVVGLLYPPNWILYCYADPADGLGLCAWLAFVIAGTTMFGLARALALPHLAALFAALAFQLGATLTANAHFYQRLDALVWLPGMLWAVHAIAHGDAARRLRGVVGLALATFFTWTAGFAPYAAPATFLAGLFLIWRAFGEARTGGLRAARSATLTGAAGFALGFVLAAVQLLPMFAFFPESNRNPHPTPDAIASQGFDPLGLLGYLMPDAFGSPLTTAALPYEKSPFVWWLSTRAGWAEGAAFPPNYNFIEYAVFPGTLTLVLAGIGLASATVRLRWFAVFALLVLHGLANAGAWIAPLLRLPGLESVPPMRFVGPACVVVALLAGSGLAALRRGTVPLRPFAVGSALLAAGALIAYRALAHHTGQSWLDAVTPDLIARYGKRFANIDATLVRQTLGNFAEPGLAQLRSNLLYAALAFGSAALWLLFARRTGRLGTLAAITATVVELAMLAEPQNRGRTLLPETDTAVHRFLRAERDRHAEDGGITVARAGYAVDPASGAQVPTLPFMLPPCTLVPERIRDLHIYTFVDGRSHLCFKRIYGQGHMHREYWPLAFLDDARLELPFFDLLGLRYLLSTQRLEHAGPKVGPEWKGPGGEFFVYERPNALPRAFLVGGVQVVPDDEAAITAIVDPKFRPKDRVVLTPDQLAVLDAPSLDPAAAGRTAKFVLDANNHLVIEVGPGPAGLLVLSDACMSGWTAVVSGAPTQIARGDLFCRVVRVPAGACTVEMRYRTPRLVAGLAVTLLGGLVVLVLLFRAFRAQLVAQYA